MIKQKGIASGLMLVMMAVAFVGLLGASAMVKKNQDTRNRAADYECQSSSECADGYVCKNFYCVKSGEPAPKCKEGDVQRCQISGRAGQKECTGGKWSRCVETSSDAQDKCGMTAAELKKAEANCKRTGQRWDVRLCNCVAIPKSGGSNSDVCTKNSDCLSGRCANFRCVPVTGQSQEEKVCIAKGCFWNRGGILGCSCSQVSPTPVPTRVICPEGCPAGAYCNFKTGCEPIMCWNNSDCKSGERCVGFECMEAP